MQQKTMSTALMLCIGLLSAGAACAKVPATEADKLGKELTCTGAIKAGNADGSIPPFTGKFLGVPPGVKFTKSVGQFQPDIYANEKPLFEITAANMAQYGDKLSAGQKTRLQELFETEVDMALAEHACTVANRPRAEAIASEVEERYVTEHQAELTALAATMAEED